MSPSNIHARPFLALAKPKLKPIVTLLVTVLFSLASSAQEPTSPPPNQPVTASNTALAAAITVPAGTYMALVLTHPIQSRNIHRGDDIYAQITSPVTSGNEVVIPAGTLVQGKVDKLGRHGNRGELLLQSMAVAFPDGYVAPIEGPITLRSNEGYALKDPGQGRVAGAVLGPLAGSGIGALIGHSVASSKGTTLTTSAPPGCVTGSFGCLTSSVTGPPDKGKDTVIGAAIGGGVGLVAGLLIATSSHQFFLDVGAPVEMVLQHPLTLETDQVADAIRDAAQHPIATQPVSPRPRPIPPPPNTDPATCYTPGTPGTPDIDIPGTPAIGNSPGTPATHIPGIPATPPTSHPCP